MAFRRRRRGIRRRLVGRFRRRYRMPGRRRSRRRGLRRRYVVIGHRM
jgi:hypothetical protein